MEIIWTDGADERFQALCAELDEHLNDAVGGASQRAHYNAFNSTVNIHDVVLLAEDGIALACGSFKQLDEHTVEMKRVFVRPQARRRGLGRQVVRLLLARAAAAGFQRMVLETGRTFTAACTLYQAEGFALIENYGPYRDLPQSVCMEIQLPPTA